MPRDGRARDRGARSTRALPATLDGPGFDRTAVRVVDALAGEALRPHVGEPTADAERDAQLLDRDSGCCWCARVPTSPAARRARHRPPTARRCPASRCSPCPRSRRRPLRGACAGHCGGMAVDPAGASPRRCPCGSRSSERPGSWLKSCWLRTAAMLPCGENDMSRRGVLEVDHRTPAVGVVLRFLRPARQRVRRHRCARIRPTARGARCARSVRDRTPSPEM